MVYNTMQPLKIKIKVAYSMLYTSKHDSSLRALYTLTILILITNL